MLRSPTDAVRREGLARDLLHDRDGALAYKRPGPRVGAHAVARDAASGVGGAKTGRPRWLGRPPQSVLTDGDCRKSVQVISPSRTVAFTVIGSANLASPELHRDGTASVCVPALLPDDLAGGYRHVRPRPSVPSRLPTASGLERRRARAAVHLLSRPSGGELHRLRR